jgi:hydroxymethylbilane synthase
VSTLRLATRSSLQARTQSEFVAGQLRSSGIAVELVFVDTMGDRRQDVPLHTIGGQGVFAKEVQNAVLEGRADFAVHSAKDLPSTPTDGLVIAAIGARRDPRDVLVGRALSALAPGATVATGSVRRRAQLSRLRPDLRFVELRGNIPTRLEKIPTDGSIVMAAAALEVLGWSDRITEHMSIDDMIPAVGQGCVAVECRLDDARTREALSVVDHATSRRSVEIERAFLAELGSGCSLPVGAHDDGSSLRAYLASDDGGEHHIGRLTTDGLTIDAALVGARDLARAAKTAVGG